MRVLFFIRHNGFVRNFEWLLRLLAERGNEVELAFQFERGEGEIERQLDAEYPNVTVSRAPARKDFWTYVVYRLRHAIDYLRYLRPEYEHAPKLRARGRKRAPRLVVWLARLRFVGPWLEALLRALERAIPRPRGLERFISKRRPHVVLVTPLVDGPWQEDYVAAAKALGIPTALLVASWDNLTNKGVIRLAPDRVYVWNEIQRREAIELHGVSPESAVAVGGHSYDHWFRWSPSTTREEFCARVGLKTDAPIVLYLCSSGFVAEDIESEIVAEWLAALRASGDPALESASILVRPHFRARWTWVDDPLAGWENVAVWPEGGADPRTPGAKADYFDSLYHSAATVGANTTALIEAAIVGRRSFTFLHPELKETQEGTLHFHYLTTAKGGPLETAGSIEEHLVALAEALRESPDPGWNRTFVESFIRPHGLDVDAAPLLADEVARLAETRPEPLRAGGAGTLVLRALLFPLALLSNAGRGTRLWKRLFPRDVRADDRLGGPKRRRRPLRRVGRRAFYRTVHAVLPRKVRESLRDAVRGPRPASAELDPRKQAQKDARDEQKQARAEVKKRRERVKSAAK